MKKSNQNASVLCPLAINQCAKQITSYPEGQEKIWCCDDLCTNIKGQIKLLENKKAKRCRKSH